MFHYKCRTVFFSEKYIIVLALFSGWDGWVMWSVCPDLLTEFLGWENINVFWINMATVHILSRLGMRILF